MTLAFEHRAQQAHRNAFAAITGALAEPKQFDPESFIAELMDESTDPGQTVIDLAHVLVWHAAGAILTHAGNTEAALHLIRDAALQQEQSGGNHE